MSFGEEGENRQNLEHLVSGFNIRNYFANDFKNTVSDFKKIGGYACRRVLPIVLITALAWGAKCPWDKSKDDDTTSGSSGPRVLSQAGYDALDLRFGRDEVFGTAAGTKAASVDEKAESDDLLKWIANSTDSDADAVAFMKILYDAEAANAYNTTCGGTSVTEVQYRPHIRNLFKTFTNGITSAQTTEDAPFPIDAKITDYEIDNKMADSGWGFVVDGINNIVAAYLKNESGNEIVFPKYNLTPTQMTDIKALIKKSFAQTYLTNEIDGNKFDASNSYSPTTGEQIKQSDFDE